MAQSGDDDNQFDELAWLMAPARGNVFGVDPQLAAPFDLVAPDFTPAPGSPVATGASAVPDDGWYVLTGSSFMGAVAPGGTPFYAGWTTFPEN